MPMLRYLLTGAATLALSATALAEDQHGDEHAGHETAEHAAAKAPATAGQTDNDAVEPAALPAIKLPGFSALLANLPLVDDASNWTVVTDRESWTAIARSSEENRQAARWDYARSLIGRDRAPEALGVLSVMAQDDPDLTLVPAFRLALGAALTGLRRYDTALEALAAERLADNSEACALRMQAMVELNQPAAAREQFNCARDAVNARDSRQRKPFLVAAARAAAGTGDPRRAITLLESLPASDPTANLVRGKAFLQLGERQEGRLRLEQVIGNGSPEQRAAAQLTQVEEELGNAQLEPRLALAELAELSYGWRGDATERRALALQYELAGELKDDSAALRAGATLFRHYPADTDSGQMLAALQARLGKLMVPDNDLPLPLAAGLFWDYRDLAPTGARGDLLVNQLADRLQAGQLFDRAAELLDYQLTMRAKDVAQGPLSVRVAKLYILSGKADRALQAIRKTDGNIYPDTMRWSRRKIEAVALVHLGKTDEALAVLDDVPDGDVIRQEIEWRRRNWKALADGAEAGTPAARSLSEVDQAMILRRAVAMAMLGREKGLEKLRSLYADEFASLPSGAAFDLLTAPVDQVDPNAIAEAMAAIPSASPAADIADLLSIDAKPA